MGLLRSAKGVASVPYDSNCLRVSFGMLGDAKLALLEDLLKNSKESVEEKEEVRLVLRVFDSAALSNGNEKSCGGVFSCSITLHCFCRGGCCVAVPVVGSACHSTRNHR